MDNIAGVLRGLFESANVVDSNGEPANIVDVIDKLGYQIVKAAKLLGNNDAATPMGALEAHGKAILDGCENIASAINNLADAVREHNPAVL